MSLLVRVLSALCVALLVAGGTGLETVRHHPGQRRSRPLTAAPAGAATGTEGLSPPTAPGAPPGPSSAALAAGLVTPTDMGGYYHQSPEALSAFFGGSPCLAPFLPSSAQSGRAAEALVTADRWGVPEIVEVVISYPAGEAHAVFADAAAVLGDCRSFSLAFDGYTTTASLQSDPAPAVGDEERTWKAPFSVGGTNFVAQIAIVRQGQEVFLVVWTDLAHPSPAIMGDFPSTVSLAMGKEA